MSGIERTAAFVACQTDVRPAKRQKVENARAAFQHLARTAGEGQWDAACEAVGFKPEFQLRPTDVETVSCFVNKYVRVRRNAEAVLDGVAEGDVAEEDGAPRGPERSTYARRRRRVKHDDDLEFCRVAFFQDV